MSCCCGCCSTSGVFWEQFYPPESCILAYVTSLSVPAGSDAYEEYINICPKAATPSNNCETKNKHDFASKVKGGQCDSASPEIIQGQYCYYCVDCVEVYTEGNGDCSNAIPEDAPLCAKKTGFKLNALEACVTPAKIAKWKICAKDPCENVIDYPGCKPCRQCPAYLTWQQNCIKSGDDGECASTTLYTLYDNSCPEGPSIDDPPIGQPCEASCDCCGSSSTVPGTYDLVQGPSTRNACGTLCPSFSIECVPSTSCPACDPCCGDPCCGDPCCGDPCCISPCFCDPTGCDCDPESPTFEGNCSCFNIGCGGGGGGGECDCEEFGNNFCGYNQCGMCECGPV